AIWPSREFFEAKMQEQRARHARYHDTAYNLEPNLKEGPGGLRDVQMVGWVAKRHFGANTLDELVSHRFLTSSEHALLIEGQDFLWSVRFALHTLSGRREDRLLFDLQRRVAQAFGYLDDDANLAVEKFMKRYYRTAMALSHLNELLLELFQEAILAAHEPTELHRVNRRFRTVNGALEVSDARVFARQPFALLELFLILQQHEDIEGVRASTIRLVRDHVHLIDDDFRDDLRCRSLFLEIFRQPRGINHGLRRMHRYGVLGAYLPVFGEVVGRMQYDLFHAYTVDEHTLFVVRNLRAFSDPTRRDELPLCSHIADTLPKPELLYLAGLFHDIAKGRSGDHSELGAGDAAAFCQRHGLSEYDARLVSWLVRHHLLMSITAQKRDIADPDVVAEFAATVGDQSHLDYLYLLTVADIRGTNPNLWSNWKGTLLADLYHSTARSLRRGLENPPDRETLIASSQREARELLAGAGVVPALAQPLWDTLGEDYFVRYSANEIAWHTAAILDAGPDALPLVAVRDARGGSEVFVYAPDRKHLFATTTSVLGREGLNIVEARVITADNGMTLDAYLVLDLHAGSGTPPLTDPDRQRALRDALACALESEQTARAVVVRRLTPRKLESFDRPTDVSISPDTNHMRTVIEVNSRDRPGLLGRIGWAFADTGVRLQTAKIATFGERAEDVFYVTDTRNQPLEPARFDTIAEHIAQAIDAADDG
ncbi:MAG: [protein-PII] uridylyltransferase, partial [Gammaproteobacteria bacterium]